MNFEPILISVIVPVKNRIEQLKNCILSVLNQTYNNWELLIVDDKSEEDIRTFIKSFKDNRIKYFLNQKNTSNANVCRNIGIENAQGFYIAMLDSDDEWLPDHLTSRIIFLNENDCDGCFGSAYVDDGEKRTLRLSRDKGSKESMIDYLLSNGKAPTPSHFYKKLCVSEVMWDEKLLRHQDYDFSIRFDEKFKFISCEIPTVIIHWKKGERRFEDFNSQIYFIQKHKNKINPFLYNNYHYGIFMNIKNRKDLDSNIINHYKKESIRNIKFVNFSQYASVNGDDSFISKIANRFMFAFKILISR
jgi:glycosyltransferase involved in cell wall biosynthesis